MRMIESIDEVFDVLAGGGRDAYFGEPVTVLEHSLQAAWFVQRKNPESSLVVAALLHDFGHLLHEEGEDAASRGVDTHHEELGVEALKDHFPAEVLAPIHLHVAAKRYLCFAEPRYLAALSPTSVQSLGLQGGPMSSAEAEAFLASPHARDAITLRHADDAAKVEGFAVPALDSYRRLVEALWR
jgi:[1-hydroxy-2-(trimethylamino)ethyl]phosphonate dioxygenase